MSLPPPCGTCVARTSPRPRQGNRRLLAGFVTVGCLHVSAPFYDPQRARREALTVMAAPSPRAVTDVHLYTIPCCPDGDRQPSVTDSIAPHIAAPIPPLVTHPARLRPIRPRLRPVDRDLLWLGWAAVLLLPVSCCYCSAGTAPGSLKETFLGCPAGPAIRAEMRAQYLVGPAVRSEMKTWYLVGPAGCH